MQIRIGLRTSFVLQVVLGDIYQIIRSTHLRFVAHKHTQERSRATMIVVKALNVDNFRPSKD